MRALALACLGVLLIGTVQARDTMLEPAGDGHSVVSGFDGVGMPTFASVAAPLAAADTQRDYEHARARAHQAEDGFTSSSGGCLNGCQCDSSDEQVMH